MFSFVSSRLVFLYYKNKKREREKHCVYNKPSTTATTGNNVPIRTLLLEHPLWQVYRLESIEHDLPDICGLNTINGTAGGRKSPGSPFVLVTKRKTSSVNNRCILESKCKMICYLEHRRTSLNNRKKIIKTKEKKLNK